MRLFSGKLTGVRTKYAMGSALVASAALYYVTPDAESNIRKQFSRNAFLSPHNTVKWTFALYAVGITNKINRFDTTFFLSTKMIETYLTLTNLTRFEENTAEDGKHPVFFRGVGKSAAKLNSENNLTGVIFSTHTNEFSLPAIQDATLTPFTGCSEGFSHGLISMTPDLEIASMYGQHILVIAPSKTKVAAVAQHATKIGQNHQCEYVTAGVHKSDVLGKITIDPETEAACQFELNPKWTGDISTLKLDAQFKKIISLLPDSEPRKLKLFAQVDENYSPVEAYDDKLACCADSHKLMTEKRREEVMKTFHLPFLWKIPETKADPFEHCENAECPARRL